MPNMSGVVVKLNDDEEEDEDDTGLLSRRGYDDSDEDLDDLRHKSGMETRSGSGSWQTPELHLRR